TDSDGNTLNISRIIKVRSNEKPVLKGVEDTTIKVGDGFDPLAGILAMDEEDGDLSELIEVTGEVNENVVGEYALIYSITDDDNNTVIAKRVVNVRSNDVPIINGVDSITLKQGDPFDPMLNIEALDTEDGNLTDKITVLGEVDTNNIGLYRLTYSVIDSDENETIIRRKVKVRSNDKPEIIGVDNVVIEIGDNFNPLLGVEVIDTEDGDISNLITITGIVDNRIQGNYPLIYSIKDSDGNISSITRTITVKPSNAPIILGIEDTSLKLGETFDLMSGVLAKDSNEEDISEDIEVLGFVDNTKSGTYKLIYMVSDDKGNKIILSRNVVVENPTEPIIVGAEDIVVNLNYKFDAMSGIEIHNLKEGVTTTSIDIIGTVDTGVEGDYNLIYAITDSEGNKFTVERVISVTSEDALILNGADDITLRVGDTFDPMVGVMLNNYKGEDLTAALKITGTVNTNIPGIYRVIYSALDKDGNLRATTRDIRIVDKNTPIIYGINDLILNLGDRFDPLLGITVRGLNSSNLNSNVKVIGTVDTNNPGTYNLVYNVINEQGKVSTFNRNIEVKNKNGNLIRGVDSL
ncbi:MAG: immunoglobulin-like domain-containing protein, partial [Sarcina sp.]